MKTKNNTLKIILAILVVILISLISFIGIFVKDKNKMKNILPEYELGMDFAGGRVFNIKPDESATRKYYDVQGNEVDADTAKAKESDYTIKEVIGNKEVTLNDENYEKVKNTVEARLKELNISEYEIRKNSSTGEIYITIPENTYTDTIVSDMTPRGDFEIIDSESNSEKLITSAEIKLIEDKLKEEKIEDYKIVVKSTKTAEQTESAEGTETAEATETIQINIVVPEGTKTDIEISGLESYKFSVAEVEGTTILTSDEVKEIKEKMKETGYKEYSVRKNNNEEEIFVAVSDEKNTKISEIGRFKVKGTLLLSSEDIKDVKVGYGNTQEGTVVFLNVQYDKKALNEISKTYVSKTDENDQTNQKQVDILLDGEKQLTTSFEEEVKDGILQLSMGNTNSSSATTEQLQKYLTQASNLAALLKAEEMPLTYTLDTNLFVKSDITNDVLKVFAIMGLVVAGIIAIFTIVKYKKQGVLSVISLIGFVATLLIALRYAHVTMTVTGVLAVVISIIMNYIYMIKLIVASKKDKKAFKNTSYKFISIYIPCLIISVVFSFAKYLPIVSFGNVMFWAILIMIVYNCIITKTLIDTAKENK